jgi:mannose-1-phosphate guanylyltransferase
MGIYLQSRGSAGTRSRAIGFEQCMKSENKSPARWAIVLAGGDGRRLTDLTRRIASACVPKQFCPLFGGESLIEQTRKRLDLIVRKERICYALTRSHERYYRPLLSDVSSTQLAIQPLNRGTAPAVLYAAMRLGLTDPGAHVALFPCDHYVSDGRALMHQVQIAFDLIVDQPELVVVLGMTPSAPEPDRIWIDPASGFHSNGQTLFHVRRFLHKPPIEVARRLWADGRYLWNSSILVARLPNLLALLIRALPGLYDVFSEFSDTLGTQFEDEAVEYIYRSVAATEFHTCALTAEASHHIRVLPVAGLYWNDLDNASQVLSTMTRVGARPKWLL